jgi:hypothetical protein
MSTSFFDWVFEYDKDKDWEFFPNLKFSKGCERYQNGKNNGKGLLFNSSNTTVILYNDEISQKLVDEAEKKTETHVEIPPAPYPLFIVASHRSTSRK